MSRPSVHDVRGLRGVRQLSQVYVATDEWAAACDEAGIDIVVTEFGHQVERIGAAAPNVFFQVGVPYGTVVNADEALRSAFLALEQGASAIYCAASLKIVEAMADEGIPVVGHIGIVPSQVTWTNFRAIGKTFDEAKDLYRKMKAYEGAGAFGIEFEVIPEPIATALTQRTSLVTMSMGSGSGCNTQYLFATDILGENTGHVPRHAKVYRDFAARRREMYDDAVAAFREYADDIESGEFPDATRLVAEHDGVAEAFAAFLDERD